MTENWDVFISHASEDKETFARPLAEALQKRGYRVWYDDFTLKLGDSLRRTIDRGLYESRYGIVILSKAFFKKDWPQKELDGLFTREKDGKKVILPIWHNLTKEEVETYSPMLAGKLASKTKNGLDSVIKDIIEVIGLPLPSSPLLPSESTMVTQIIQMLHDGSDSERNRAARKLHEFNLPHVVDALLEAAKYDRTVRYEALLALHELRSEKARGIFIERLEDPSPKIRRISILALGEIGESATIEPLQKIIDTNDFNFLNKQRKGGKGQRTNWGKSENVMMAKNAILSIERKIGIPSNAIPTAPHLSSVPIAISKFWVHIDPIGDYYAGDTFRITGTTNIPTGDQVLITVVSASFQPTQTGEFSGASGTVSVQSGTPYNTFYFDVDTSPFIPGQYTVQAESSQLTATYFRAFNLLNIQRTKSVAATARRKGNQIIVTWQGGQDNKLVASYSVAIGTSAVHGYTPIVGQSNAFIINSSAPSNVVIVAHFTDGTSQVILDINV